MELKEAVTILKTIDVSDLRELCDVTEETYDEAICEVLDKLEELQKENELARKSLIENSNIADERNDLLVEVQKLKKENEEYSKQLDLDYVDENYIRKDKLIEIIDFGVEATNTNDDYSIGMCNGMIYIKSVILNKDIEYKKCQKNEEENTYEFGLIVGTKREREYWQNKIKEKIEEQTKRIDKLLEDMVDKSTGCINVSYLSKKEKEEVIAKRNSLIVQRATLQQVKEELLKGA